MVLLRNVLSRESAAEEDTMMDDAVKVFHYEPTQPYGLIDEAGDGVMNEMRVVKEDDYRALQDRLADVEKQLEQAQFVTGLRVGQDRCEQHKQHATTPYCAICLQAKLVAVEKELKTALDFNDNLLKPRRR